MLALSQNALVQPSGVHPLVGLHGAVLMCGVVSLFGSRPGMISGAAGATAVVTGTLVASHGVEYLFACMAMAGALQLVFGGLRLGKLIRLVPTTSARALNINKQINKRLLNKLPHRKK
eukprot:4483906-Pyramimonas_sp.AAC.1